MNSAILWILDLCVTTLHGLSKLCTALIVKVNDLSVRLVPDGWESYDPFKAAPGDASFVSMVSEAIGKFFKKPKNQGQTYMYVSPYWAGKLTGSKTYDGQKPSLDMRAFDVPLGELEDERAAAIRSIRDGFGYAVDAIERYCPFGGSKEESLRKMREAFFWAQSAVDSQDDGSRRQDYYNPDWRWRRKQG